jgi:Pentapeptide repeats (8 copies)
VVILIETQGDCGGVVMADESVEPGARTFRHFGRQLVSALARDTPAFSRRSPTRLDLRGVDLKGVDLGDADLKGADLHEADLTAANLENVNLHDADLRGASLRRARLVGANLDGADLVNADLGHADLADSVWSRATQWPSDLAATIESRSDEVESGLFRVRPHAVDVS